MAAYVYIVRAWRGTKHCCHSKDTYIFSSIDEIIEKFVRFGAPMVVSGEVNIWPNPHLASHLPLDAGAQYKYPNSGGYIG